MTFAFDALPFAPAWLCLLAPALFCIAAVCLEIAAIALGKSNPLWGMTYVTFLMGTVCIWLLSGAAAVGCSIFIWRLF